MDVLTKIAVEVKLHVIALYHKYQYPALLFHNLFHTSEVVDRSEELADHYSLSHDDRFAVVAAAWFHDTGHLFAPMRGHEKVSWKMAKEFLLPLGLEKEILVNVKNCILATQMPTNPKQLIEQIICDADTYHLGTASFTATDALIKGEMILREHINPDKWDSLTLAFLKNHRFYTSYCIEKLTAHKNVNIQMIESRLFSSR